MNVAVIRGADAHQLLSTDEFQARWARLCDQCPWSTAYQTPGFARAWYMTYRSRWEPLLMVARGIEGQLQGLLPLAVAPATGELVAAGAHQAEYQSWISPPALGDAFAVHAIRALRRQIPSAVLKLWYLPPDTPVGWTAEPEANRTCPAQGIPAAAPALW